MKYLLYFIFIFLTSFVCQKATCQESYHRKFNYKDGFNSGAVYVIRQDKKGKMWFGTENGLYQFSGNKFQSFDLHPYSNKEVYALEITNKNVLFFLNISGELGKVNLNLKQPKVEKISFKNPYPDHKIFDLRILGDDLFIRQRKALSVKAFYLKLDYKSDVISNTLVPFNGSIQAHLEPNINKISSFEFIKDTLFKTTFKNAKLNYDTTIIKCEIDFVRKNEALLYDLVKKELGELCEDYISFENPRCVIKYDSLIYFGYSNGFLEWNVATKSFKTRTHNYSQVSVNFVFIDKNSNIWLATNSDGVYLIPSLDFCTSNTSDKILSNENIIETIHLGNEIIIVSSSGSFYKYSNNTSELIFQLNQTIYSIYFFNEIYFITTKDGIYETQDFVHFQKKSDVACKALINVKGTWLIGLHNGLYISTLKKEELIGCLTQRITFLVPLTENSYLVGTDDGLFVNENQELCQFEKIANGYVDEYKKIKNGYFVELDGDYDLYVKFIDSKVKCERVYKKLRTSKNAEYRLLDKNIYNYISQLKLFQIVLEETIVNSVNFTSDYIYLSTINGLYTFPSSSLSSDNICDAVTFSNPLISAVEVNGEIHSEDIKITTPNQNISIFLTSDLYSINRLIEYEYSFCENCTKWEKVKNGKINLYDVKNGDIEIYVKLKFADCESEIKKLLKINVDIPVHLQEGFLIKAIMSLVIILLISFAYFFISIFRRKLAIKELEFMKSKLRFSSFQNQINPHFIFNALNSIQLHLLKKSRIEIMEHLSKFAHLVHQILSTSQSEYNSINNEIQFIDSYTEMENMRRDEKVAIVWKFQDEIRNVRSTRFLPPLLLQPIVENCFKHAFISTEAESFAEIEIEIKYQDSIGCVAIKISDNGNKNNNAKARNSFQQSSYVGLENVKQRILLHNNSKSIKPLVATNNKIGGFTVTINIKVNDEFKSAIYR